MDTGAPIALHRQLRRHDKLHRLTKLRHQRQSHDASWSEKGLIPFLKTDHLFVRLILPNCYRIATFSFQFCLALTVSLPKYLLCHHVYCFMENASLPPSRRNASIAIGCTHATDDTLRQLIDFYR